MGGHPERVILDSHLQSVSSVIGDLSQAVAERVQRRSVGKLSPDRSTPPVSLEQPAEMASGHNRGSTSNSPPNRLAAILRGITRPPVPSQHRRRYLLISSHQPLPRR